LNRSALFAMIALIVSMSVRSKIPPEPVIMRLSD
jgi:hypothetical protein